MSEGKKIKIGLLGAGRIGAMHADNLVAHPQFELRAVFDTHTPAAEAVASKYPGVQAVADAENIFSAKDLDAVLVASITETHCEFIERAVGAGKAVLCEKPLSLDTKVARETRAKLQKGHPPIQLGFNRRFDPGHRQLCDSVKAEMKLEKLIITSRDPYMLDAQYLKNSGGLFKDMMIHDFDIARYALPEEPATIYATGSALVNPAACQQFGDVDTAVVVLRTASGVLCTIHCSRRAAYGYDQRMEAFGDIGMFISANKHSTQFTKFTADATEVKEPLPEFFIERYADAYRLQLDAFAAVVQGKDADVPNFEDGYRALVLAELAGESMRAGKALPITY